jgi:lactoylglutathione lyase
MNFSHVTIPVRDLEASIAFYRDIIGLPVTRRFPGGPDTEIAFVGEGETAVELIHNKKNRAFSLEKGVSLGFETASAGKLRASLLEKGVPEVGDIIQPGPGVRLFFISDPNGVPIEFVETPPRDP